MSDAPVVATQTEILSALTARRWLAAAAWIIAIGTTLALATIDDAWGKFTPSRFAMGLYFSSLFALPIALALTHPTKPEFDVNAYLRRRRLVLLGARIYYSFAGCAGLLYALVSEQRDNGIGPVDTTSFTLIALTGLSVAVFDLWHRTPRAVADPSTDRPLLDSSGQPGLVDRGYSVSVWLVPIYLLAPLVLFEWGLSSFPGEALALGLSVGIAAGIAAAATVSYRARGSYADRVSRYSKHSEQPVSRQMIYPAVIGISGLAVAGFAIDVQRFGSFMIAVSVMCTIGLLSTVIDRWIVVPQQMQADLDDQPPRQSTLEPA